jgi:hypothetical protein
VAEWLSRWPRDPTLHRSGQASQWAFGSQGFESLPRRHFALMLCAVMMVLMVVVYTVCLYVLFIHWVRSLSYFLFARARIFIEYDQIGATAGLLVFELRILRLKVAMFP